MKRGEELCKLTSGLNFNLYRAILTYICPRLNGLFYTSIFLESTKTDEFRQGAWIVIARTSTPTCLVKSFERHIAVTNTNPCSVNT